MSKTILLEMRIFLKFKRCLSKNTDLCKVDRNKEFSMMKSHNNKKAKFVKNKKEKRKKNKEKIRKSN